jgi:hypothetical protein
MRRPLVALGVLFALFAVYQSATGNGYGTEGGAVGKVRPIFGGDSQCVQTFPEGPGIAALPSACFPPAAGTPRAEAPGPDAQGSAPVSCSTEMGRILTTIKGIESSGKNWPPNAGGASGLYQFIDQTWNGFGGYRSAYLAPESVQDAKATEHVQHWLNVGGVETVPVGWYYPLALQQPALMDQVPAAWAGNNLTPRQYQTKWLNDYRRNGASCA